MNVVSNVVVVVLSLIRGDREYDKDESMIYYNTDDPDAETSTLSI